MKQFFIMLVAVLLLIGLAGMGYMYSGAFNVAATSKDSALLSWILETTRESSIESRAEDIKPLEEAELNKPEMLSEGFEHYNEMCVVCHGAPGVDAGEAREGLNPKPPLLAKLKDVSTDPANELFWIIKNGIKMTAMPAWGPTHSDEKIWAMTAFVRKLPTMTPAEYQTMREQMKASGHSHESGHSHDAGHEEMGSEMPAAKSGHTHTQDEAHKH